MRLYLVALNPTTAVTHGYLPAAARLGLEVTILTDQPEAHQRAYEAAGHGPAAIERTNPGDARQLISSLLQMPRPDALFSNSDTVQEQTALAASYLALPGKDWRSTVNAKNKWLMRCALADLDPVFAFPLNPDVDIEAIGIEQFPYPLILKPTEGVASEEVVQVANPKELRTRYATLRKRRPTASLLIEQQLTGQMRTFEVLRDGVSTWVLGGYRTKFSAAPYFIEEQFEWAGDLPQHATDSLLNQLDKLGLYFGWCHVEVAFDGHRARIIEVNDRVIGGHLGILLGEILTVSPHEQILQVFLGEKLGDSPPPPQRLAMAEYLVAPNSGTLIAAPSSTDHTDGATTLRYRPMRAVGDVITKTHSNRDKLGVIRVTGTDRQQMRHAISSFRAEHEWIVQP